VGIFGTLKTAIHIATLGQSALIEKSLEVGGKLVEITIDVGNQIVRIGEDVFRAVPGEVFFPGIGPLAGLLKNEIEDELILLNPFGIVPSVTVFINAAVVIGDLIGVVQQRPLRDDEFEVARHVFRGSLPPRNSIRLTNLAGFEGRPFTVPFGTGGALVNLGQAYVHDRHIDDLPTLVHELAHAWQIARSALPEVFICNGALVQLKNEITDAEYDYTPGLQWDEYGLEQQAHIVEDWVEGPAPMRLASPLFRYLNANVRRADTDARTAGGGSLRKLFAEARAKTLSLREINPPAPAPWWV
jgi:hypothetical protein